MRYLSIIFIICFLLSCVKPKTESPVPLINYLDFTKSGKFGQNGQDTAVLVFGFEDGDGDLFRDNKSDDPNIVFTPYYFYPDSGKFIKGAAFAYVLVQPSEGYYKDKSIKGEIMVPLSQFRPNDLIKNIKFEFFMMDMKNNKSNVVITPTITLNF